MEYGLVAKVDQFSDNRALDMQKVQASNSSSEVGVNTKSDLEKIQQDLKIKAKETSNVQDVKNEKPANQEKYEVVLSNTSFGYNNSSKDFYVKVKRGNTENQYPTQEMMRMKAYILSSNSKTLASS